MATRPRAEGKGVRAEKESERKEKREGGRQREKRDKERASQVVGSGSRWSSDLPVAPLSPTRLGRV